MKIFNVSDSLKNYFGPVSKRLKKKSFRLMRGIKINLKIDRSNEPSSSPFKFVFQFSLQAL